MLRALLAAVLSAWPTMAQGSKDVILVAGGTHLVEVIDSDSLETYGRIHFQFPIGSVGINGVGLSADGTTVYVEGPISSAPNTCCHLYATDVATLQTGVAASIPGSPSRDSFVISEGVVHRRTSLPATALSAGMRNSRLHLSADGRWLYGVRNGGGAALTVFDVAEERVAREFALPDAGGNSFQSGTWAGDRFYLFAAREDGLGRLWIMLPETTQLGEGINVEFGRISGCREPASKTLTAAGGRLFMYEVFGFKGDRRNCNAAVPRGAWMVDPASGRLLNHVAGDVALSALMGDRTKPVLYGLGSGNLLRIDAVSGAVLKARGVDSGFLRMAVGAMRVVPSGDVVAVPPVTAR